MKEKKSKSIGKNGNTPFWNLAGIAALIAAIGGIVVPITIEIMKKTSTTSSPTSEPMVTTTSTILLKEDFEGDNIEGLVFKRDSWQIVEDPSFAGNKLLEAEEWDFIQFANSEKWKRYAFDYRINFLSNEISVILAFDDSELQMEGSCVSGESAHAVLFNPGFVGLYNLLCPNESSGHEWKQLDFSTPNIEPGKWHKVRLQVDEPNIKLWLDGVPRIEYDLSKNKSHLDHRIFRVYSKYKIQIDDILVTELE